MPDYVIERATLSDAAALRDVLEASVPEVYRSLVASPLSHALSASDEEERLLLSRDRLAGAVTGMVLFGIVPGTLGAGRVRGVAVAPLARRRGVGRALLTAAVQALEERGARFALVELPDEPAMRFLAALLEACGFAEESRAADLVRDGVAMRYMRRDLAARA
ncbi:MAG: GNAT family N-acetyltransferase [Gemmatimonadaceae bacterium]